MPAMLCPRCWGTAKDPNTGGKCVYCNGDRQVDDVSLTDHFMLSEMIYSDTAVRKMIPNDPPGPIVDNLRRTAAFLEQLRDKAGVPLHVDSGYRCTALNDAIGGSPTSAHRFGLASDILPKGGTRKWFMEICMNAGLQYDQYIYEGTWVHVGVAYPVTLAQRGEDLMAFPNPNGKMAYFPYNDDDPRVV